MADYQIVMPKMGESIQEATIIRWMVKTGDHVEEDDILTELATDKVDTEIPSPVAGKVVRILFPDGARVAVGEVIAIIDTDTGAGEQDEKTAGSPGQNVPASPVTDEIQAPVAPPESPKGANGTGGPSPAKGMESSPFKPETGPRDGRFYSPLVLSIARSENLPYAELGAIKGSGINGRVRKQDILTYLDARKSGPTETKRQPPPAPVAEKPASGLQPGDQIVEMDRMRKLIAEHMVMSKHVSAHVTNFVEADVTGLVQWRDREKDAFLSREKIKLTFMPAFVEATAQALKEFPGINASVDGTRIILRNNINIGFAVALPSGNLIVPVIKNADRKNLRGLAAELNRLAEDARAGRLAPDDIQGGTFTITNFGTFRNLTGTPIINQPQVAILATGNIEKKPAVIATPAGDAIAIRHRMMLSLSYDHRVVDGALGGLFLRRVADLLENFDTNRKI